MRDFNDLLREDEKRGKVPHPRWLLQGFREAVHESGLVELGFEGYKFTWERGRDTYNWVEEKLDCILVLEGWLELFGNATARPLEGSTSDHMALFLQTIATRKVKGKKCFLFENFLLKEDQCWEVVVQSWQTSVGHELGERLEMCGRAMRRWGKSFTRGFLDKIDRCRARLVALRGRRDRGGMKDFADG